MQTVGSAVGGPGEREKGGGIWGRYDQDTLYPYMKLSINKRYSKYTFNIDIYKTLFLSQHHSLWRYSSRGMHFCTHPKLYR